MIKESEQIEINRDRMITRIEKLSHELSLIPSTNKKKHGIDGFKNEYFFFQDLNKIFVKRPYGVWNEFTTFTQIEELIDSMSEKGVNEKSLSSKLHKLLKRNKFDNAMVIEEEIKSIFTWSNTAVKNLNTEGCDDFAHLSLCFEDLEEKITEYLYQDQKEWESFDNRQQWVKY
jgi:hypothetical protein